MKNSKKKTPWQQYVGMAFLMLLGGAAGYVIAMCIDGYKNAESLAEGLLYISALIVGMYVA